MIEKRYRTNLNDKIAALRDAVPELREAYQEAERMAAEPKAAAANGEEYQEPLDSNNFPGLKLNKATILGKACEQIYELEKKLVDAQTENNRLKTQMADLERTILMQKLVVPQTQTAVWGGFIPMPQEEGRNAEY